MRSQILWLVIRDVVCLLLAIWWLIGDGIANCWRCGGSLEMVLLIVGDGVAHWRWYCLLLEKWWHIGDGIAYCWRSGGSLEMG